LHLFYNVNGKIVIVVLVDTIIVLVFKF